MRALIVAAAVAILSGSYAAAQNAGEKPAAEADLVPASRILSQGVFTPKGERIGDVEDLVLDHTGRVKQVVVGVGGFLGIGEKLVAIPFDAVQVKETTPDASRPGMPLPPIQPAMTPGGAATGVMPGGGPGVDTPHTRLVVEMTREQLRAAPEFRTEQATASTR